MTWPGANSRAASSPEDDAVMADSVGIALLVVLETLSPPERLAFVLHDVFGVGFDEIALIVDRTPAAARQLASRARRRVRAEAPEPDADLAVQRQVIDAFVAAARGGDFEALLRVLDPDVVVTTDGGGRGPFARPPLRGAAEVAHRASRMGARFASYASPAIVNGQAGLVVDGAPGQPRIIASFRLREGRIAAIQFNADPAKTRRLEAEPR